MNKIAIIIPYFGKFPPWIPFFFHTCKQNDFIDWYLFTDCVSDDYNDKNIYYHKISFQDYCKKVSTKLNIDFNPKGAYKLCDLKPFYGYIHKEILESYKFWGFADIDTIWGNLRKFIPHNFEKEYDVFSTHNDRISGHFALFRNNRFFRELAFKIKNWQVKLKDEKNWALDELDLSIILFPPARYIIKFYGRIWHRYLDWVFAWETYYKNFHLIHKLFCFKKKRLFFKEQHATPFFNTDGRLYEYEADTWYYKNGKITNNRTEKEYMYLHFMAYKKNTFRKEYYWDKNYYHLPNDYDYNFGVEVNKKGFFAKKI